MRGMPHELSIFVLWPCQVRRVHRLTVLAQSCLLGLTLFRLFCCRPKNLRTSSMKITGKEKAITKHQSCQLSGQTAKILARRGM